jgi:murein DD-endopeptidase MepM/ murein hydrolase activator NlpD
MNMNAKTTANLRLRAAPWGATLTVLRKGEVVTVLGNADGIGQSDQWCEVRRADGTRGFSAAWYLEPLPDQSVTIDYQIPDDYPATGWAGAFRALSFRHDPVFINLPCELSKITAFSGFGRNNFAWLVHTEGGRMYRYSQDAHAGLDFFMPVGTPLVAMDWGIVMAATDAGDGNPYAAGPKSVIVRHGRCMTLYGHCSETRATPGEIVRPGDVLALSGAYNGPHLHLELRKLTDDYVTWLLAPGVAPALDLLRQANERVELRGTWMYPGMGELFVNPAPFFVRPLENYGFPHAVLNQWVDKDGNGHYDPDDLYTRESLEYYGPSVWEA